MSARVSPGRSGATGRIGALHTLRLLIDRIRGRETVLHVDLLGHRLALSIETLRELRRVRSISHEEALLERMFAHLTPGDVVYDVGANIGLVGLLLAVHPRGERSHIHSFEPEPRNHRRLLRNVELNALGDRILAHRTALGSEEGEADLFVRGGAGEGRHSIVERGGATGSIRVPVSTLSAFARSAADAPDVLKIDVEGAEGRVLAGMDAMLNTSRPREIFLELHPKGEGDRMPDGQPIRDWLGARGYELAWDRDRRSGRHCHYR